MRLLLAAFLALTFAASGAEAAKRVALVIGNGAYVHQAPLANPKNDILQMEKTLKDIGYEVTVVRDLDEDGMERALADFSEVADQAEVALVYYSGHGMEISDTNYLIPIDAELKKERDAKFEAVDLDYVRAAIEGASKLKVVILDACRNNTFLAKTRGGTRGLKRVVAQAGEVIAYSTSPGSVAQDGEPGGLSPYTRALTEKLDQSPDMDVRFLFTSLGGKTAEYAGVQQRPYTEFASIMPEGRLPIGEPRSKPQDAAFDRAIAARDVAALRTLVQDFPTHSRANEALEVIREADAAKVGELIEAALRSNDRADLLRAMTASRGHELEGEVREALEVHRRTDVAVASLNFDELDALYRETDERHPRRADIREAIRRAIVSDACSKMLAYRTICPAAVMALAQAPTAQPEPEPEPQPVAKAEPTPEPVDPIAAYVDDVSDESLAKAAAVKTEWRQVALRALGYYRGAIDGVAGPGMNSAVGRWRADLGVKETGDLTNREVVALLKQGAERNAKARAYLGVMYGIGLGVALDPAKSKKHLTDADRAGDRDAATYLKNLSANWN